MLQQFERLERYLITRFELTSIEAGEVIDKLYEVIREQGDFHSHPQREFSGAKVVVMPKRRSG